MIFTRSNGEQLTVDPRDQGSIDADKARAPGEGVGPAIASQLVSMMESASIRRTAELPAEYRFMGDLCGLAE